MSTASISVDGPLITFISVVERSAMLSLTFSSVVSWYSLHFPSSIT